MTDDREDPRSDLEQEVEAGSDAADAAHGGAHTSDLAPTGVRDGVGGTDGDVKNQDRDQQ
jgi:hypothetical protein